MNVSDVIHILQISQIILLYFWCLFLLLHKPTRSNKVSKARKHVFGFFLSIWVNVGFSKLLLKIEWIYKSCVACQSYCLSICFLSVSSEVSRFLFFKKKKKKLCNGNFSPFIIRLQSTGNGGPQGPSTSSSYCNILCHLWDEECMRWQNGSVLRGDDGFALSYWHSYLGLLWSMTHNLETADWG